MTRRLPSKPHLEAQNEFGGTPLRACIYGSTNSWRKDGDHPATVEALIRVGALPPDALRGSKGVQDVLRRYGVPE